MQTKNLIGTTYTLGFFALAFFTTSLLEIPDILSSKIRTSSLSLRNESYLAKKLLCRIALCFLIMKAVKVHISSENIGQVFVEEPQKTRMFLAADQG